MAGPVRESELVDVVERKADGDSKRRPVILGEFVDETNVKSGLRV